MASAGLKWREEENAQGCQSPENNLDRIHGDANEGVA